MFEFIQELSKRDKLFIISQNKNKNVSGNSCSCMQTSENLLKRHMRGKLLLLWGLKIHRQVTRLLIKRIPFLWIHQVSQNQLFPWQLNQQPKLIRKKWDWLCQNFPTKIQPSKLKRITKLHKLLFLEWENSSLKF